MDTRSDANATMTRRELLKGAATAGVAAGAAMLVPAANALASGVPGGEGDGEGEAFDFVLFGDTHYDRLEHHDMEWLRREKPNDVHQVENYTRISREVLPGLMQEARGHLAGKRMAFAAHVGDLIEGLDGSPELARKQCGDAIQMVRDADLGRPFVFVKGNHDITGPGAVEAFNSMLLPFAGSQAGQKLDTSYFATSHGDSLFLWYDSYSHASLDWLEQALASRRERHVFMVLHQPVAPYGARSNWSVFASPKEAKQREKLLGLLGQHRVMVLCGHLHKYGTVVRDTPAGPFLQLDVISVIPHADVKPKDMVSGVENYGPDLVRLEPHFSPESIEERRALLTAEKPFIRYYDYADAPGYAVIRVDGPKVEADLYMGTGRRLWKTMPLSDLLAKKA